MEISGKQMNAVAKARLEQFAAELQQVLRAEAPRMSAKLDDEALARFCTDSVAYAVQHGLDKKKHIAQLALCFLKMDVDFSASLPPAWVAQPRDEGKMADDDEWLLYVRNGSRVNLRAD